MGEQSSRPLPVLPGPDGEPDFDWSWVEGDEDGWVPPSMDVGRPNVARMYNLALGGKDHFEADRRAFQDARGLLPDAREAARANRRFVLEAVREMARAGIRQFLDLGAGIPHPPNVHEVARWVAPDARVVYVDHDPVVLAHLRAALHGVRGVTAVTHDLRSPASVLRDRAVRRTITLKEPVGVILGAVMHFVDQSIGASVVDGYVERLAPGSQVALSAATFDGVAPDDVALVEAVYRRTNSPVTLRSLAQIEHLFDGLDLLPPGLTDLSRGTHRLPMYAGTGRRPA